MSSFPYPPGRTREPWQRLAVVFCILFGFAFILNIHPTGDGLWYWYALALRHGATLYRDLQVPIQPLFFLLTEANQKLFGDTWLASKILAAVQVLAYCYGLLLITRRIDWEDWKKAVLIIAAFGMTIMAFYSRFDDFHITGHCLLIYSVYLLLRIGTEPADTAKPRTVLLLGLCAGLAIGNRLNDGGLLFAASFASLVVLVPNKKLRAVGLFSTATAVTLLALIALTGNSIQDWAQNTILHAANIKGGTGHILGAPIHFPIKIADDFLTGDRLVQDGLLAVIAIGLFAYLRYFRELKANRFRASVLVVGALMVSLIALRLLQQSLSGNTVLSISTAMAVATYGLFLTLLLRLIHFSLTGQLARWNPFEVLLLFPFGQLVSGAMTSGESYLEAYAPLAFLLLLLPFILPSILRQRYVLLTTGLITVCAAGSLISKTSHPYYWHHFNDRALFVDREWYDHPNFGPMYIEKPQLALMNELCSKLAHSAGNGQLLAMPWPYANYFCNRPPWHGYVQTWYDTSGKGTIEHLLADLEQRPPEWIAYQRGLDTIRSNEVTFNHGQPLPHRAVDELIAGNVRLGRWTLTWQRCFGGADWLLIHTHPPAPGEANDWLLPSSDEVNLCSRTNY